MISQVPQLRFGRADLVFEQKNEKGDWSFPGIKVYNDGSPDVFIHFRPYFEDAKFDKFGTCNALKEWKHVSSDQLEGIELKNIKDIVTNIKIDSNFKKNYTTSSPKGLSFEFITDELQKIKELLNEKHPYIYLSNGYSGEDDNKDKEYVMCSFSYTNVAPRPPIGLEALRKKYRNMPIEDR